MAKEELSSETVLRVSSEIPFLKPGWVIIEGGEPFLRPELFKILGILFEHKIAVYLISNGMLLDKDTAGRLAELSVRLMISIDGANKEDYEKTRKGANFEKLKNSVAIASEYGILDSCPITIGKHNYHQVDQLFGLARSLGYRKITLLGLKPCREYKTHVLNGEEYKQVFFSVIKNQRDNQMDVYVDEPFFLPFLKEHNIEYSADSENGVVVPDISRCIFGEYMFIETNGDIKPCTFAPLTMGNVNETGLDEIWKKMQDSELIKEIKDFSTRKNPCRDCKYLYNCGGCRSRTFNLTESWSAGDPSCPLKERIK